MPIRSTRRIFGGWARRALRALDGEGLPPVILAYHRVADCVDDPWGLCVSPARFRDQLAALKARRTIMPLHALVAGVESGNLPPNAVAITFDDGYADLADAALPLLREAGVPATLFLCSAIETPAREYWWDELARLLSQISAPAQVEVGGQSFCFGAHDSLDARFDMLNRLGALLQPMAAEQREGVLSSLRTKVVVEPQAPALPLPTATAVKLASPSITIGGHGRTHAFLPGLPKDACRDEVEGSHAELSALAPDLPITGFAYPHGGFDSASRNAVAQSPYRWAVTTQGFALNPASHDRYLLPRLEVGDWSGRALLRRMAGLPLQSARPSSGS